MANIFRDYWATPYQREVILKYETRDRARAEREKSKAYHQYANIFDNNGEQKEDNVNTNLPAETKKSFWKKIVEKLKIFLKINKE